MPHAFKKLPLIALLLSAVLSLPATAGSVPPPAPCDDLVRSCALLTDEELLAAAELGIFGLGTCYFHDRESCPGCACPYYVKVSYYPPPMGYDGGTGCLHDIKDVISTLRELCAAGTCGCPRKEVKGACITVVVWGKDPVTGTCCQYPDPCSVPDGWAHFYSEAECRGPVAPL